MDNVKFMLYGQDKKLLSGVKNTLTSGGHIFTGFSSNPSGILRHVRSIQPDLLMIEVTGSFSEVRSTIEVIDDEVLAACILILDSRADDAFDFLKKSRVVTYITKPVYDVVLMQIVDLSTGNYRRVREYEEKVSELDNALKNRKLVEKAKWLLVEKHGMTENEAYDAIRKKSRDNRMTMKDMAEAIILAGGTDMKKR